MLRAACALAVLLSGSAAQAAEPFTVLVVDSHSAPFDRSITVSGATAAPSVHTLTAREAGIVAQRADDGADIAQGEAVVTLDVEDRKALLLEAEALLAQREAEWAAARDLEKQGYRSSVQAAGTRAQLAAARARVRQAELALENTTIRSPVAGRLETVTVEAGDFVPAGTVVAEVIASGPIRFVGAVPVARARDLTAATDAEIVLRDLRIPATVVFVGNRADAATRQIKVEARANRESAALVAGAVARLVIDLPDVPAHVLAGSTLVLDDEGRVGAMVVSDGVAQWRPVRILSQDEDGFHVSGLADGAPVIVRGQHYVSPGDPVVAKRAGEVTP